MVKKRLFFAVLVNSTFRKAAIGPSVDKISPLTHEKAPKKAGAMPENYRYGADVC